MPEVVLPQSGDQDEARIALDEEGGFFSINGSGIVLTMVQAEQVASLLLNWAAKRHSLPLPEPEPGPKKSKH